MRTEKTCHTYGNKQRTKLKNKPLYNNSISSQRQRILQIFEVEQRPFSTFDFRELGIFHPAARVQELRDLGHKIITNFISQSDSNGVPHRIGSYSYHGLLKEVNDV